MLDNQKARIFISCGQREEGNELYIAKKLGKRLESMGYFCRWHIGNCKAFCRYH